MRPTEVASRTEVEGKQVPEQMKCVECGRRWYSAAARHVADRQACPACGGRLVLVDEGGPEPDAQDRGDDGPR